MNGRPTGTRRRERPLRGRGRRVAALLAALGALLMTSYAYVVWHPHHAAPVGLVDGVCVGLALGGSGLVRSYDDSWDEFFETMTLAYVLGILGLAVYLWRREWPSPFYWVEMVAGALSYAMLAFVPVLEWLGADLMLFAGTFAGWFLSGIVRSDAT